MSRPCSHARACQGRRCSRGGRTSFSLPVGFKKTLTEALWRRETHADQRDEATTSETKDLLIRRAKELESAYDLRRVFYAYVKPNIVDRSPENLAKLAIKSARSEAGQRREGGLAYLIDLEAAGITTLLMPAYKAEILRRVEAETLRDARRRLLQAGPERPHALKSSHTFES